MSRKESMNETNTSYSMQNTNTHLEPINGVKDDFQSSSDKAFDIIYNMILTGQLKPGEKLIRRKLAQITGVSTIPVLEALLRLEAAGIVESMPYRGARVVKVTYEKIRDWYALREAVECQVMRILAKSATKSELRYLKDTASILDRMEQAGETGKVFWELHYEIHLNMARYTGHQSLIDSLNRINLFHLLQRAQNSASEHISQIPKNNHMLLVDALKTGNPQTAEDAMREHIYHSGIFESSQKNISDPSPVQYIHY